REVAATGRRARSHEDAPDERRLRRAASFPARPGDAGGCLMNRQHRRLLARQQVKSGSAGTSGLTVARRPTIEAALEHHRAGRLDRAAAIYREILTTEPRQADALHLLGVIALQTGRPALAGQLIRDAIASNPAVA